MTVPVAEQLARIRRGTSEIISEAELRAKLAQGRPLVIKAGFDPTAPDLHLGHTVLLRKLRQFQDLGHTAVFLIGDATALVGDPSGHTVTRKVLTREEVEENAKSYFQQVGKILSTEHHFTAVYNSHWFLGTSAAGSMSRDAFGFTQFVNVASRVTVARLIEREDVHKRLKAGKPVSFLELFYPIMQGYDSVQIADRFNGCDVELGGTDQKFNLLMGRELLREYGNEPQVVITMPLLEGTDGVRKMSKSLGNHVGINDPPGEMFGKLMSIPDTRILTYATLLTDWDAARLSRLDRQLATRAVNPRDAKAEVASAIVAMYHDAEAARQARQEFASVFSRRETPTDIPVVLLRPNPEGRIDLIELLVAEGLAKTKNEARRLLRQGAVKLDGKPLRSPAVSLQQLAGATLHVGKRHFRKLVVP